MHKAKKKKKIIKGGDIASYGVGMATVILL